MVDVKAPGQTMVTIVAGCPIVAGAERVALSVWMVVHLIIVVALALTSASQSIVHAEAGSYTHTLMS